MKCKVLDYVVWFIFLFHHDTSAHTLPPHAL